MNSERTFSFEFFPPKTEEGAQKLRVVRAELAPLSPRFMSVTFGAGGSTREGTLATVKEIVGEGRVAAPHLSCIGSSREHLRDILDQYRALGVKRLVALRGDMPSGMGPAEMGELRYASQLVEFVRVETGDWFHIEVAAYPEVHPQARSAAEDLKHFVEKMRCGADSAITQYFFNPDAYFRLCDEARKAGVTQPIVPGIMPISSYVQLARFSDACGAEIPRWIRMRLAGYGDDVAAIRAFGLDVITALCARLLEGGAPGLHFYTLNQSAATLEIWRRLKL